MSTIINSLHVANPSTVLFLFLPIALLIVLHLFMETSIFRALNSAVKTSAMGRQDIDITVVAEGLRRLWNHSVCLIYSK